MKLVYAQPSPFVRKIMVLLEEAGQTGAVKLVDGFGCLLYTSPSPRDRQKSRMPSSA